MRTTALSKSAAADRAIEAVVRLAKDIGIPDSFSQVNPNYPKSRMGRGDYYGGRPTEIKSDDAELQWLAKHMIDDPCTAGNPRDVTEAGLVELLRDCVYEPMERSKPRTARV